MSETRNGRALMGFGVSDMMWVLLSVGECCAVHPAELGRCECRDGDPARDAEEPSGEGEVTRERVGFSGEVGEGVLFHGAVFSL